MIKKEAPHYVNNREFSEAVVEYIKTTQEAEESGESFPQVTNYIASCFLKIAQGLSYKSNFIRYTYREEMVMDAVENCLKAIYNYNIDTPTRTGKPNAFAYFTQISWWAFLRRIAKEKKQQDIKLKYISQSGIDEFLIDDNEDPETAQAIRAFVDQIRRKVDENKPHSSKEEQDYFLEPSVPKKNVRSRNLEKKSDSDLSDFFTLDEEDDLYN